MQRVATARSRANTDSALESSQVRKLASSPPVIEGMCRRGTGGPFSTYAAHVETLGEQDVCKQIARAHCRPETLPAQLQMPQLPGGGRFDEHLLEPGGAYKLLPLMAELFRHDPPSDAGRRPNAAGKFHNFEHVYGRKIFSPAAVVNTLTMASELWGAAPNVLHMSVDPEGRCILVGDTHGQLEDVLWIFFKYGIPSSTNQYIFIGDVVDRGGHALEIILLIAALARDNPKSVYLLRGNHEESIASGMYGFKAEIESKFGESRGGWVYRCCTERVFPSLPIAARVCDQTGTMAVAIIHGGVPTGIKGQSGPFLLDGQISQLNRKVVSFQHRRTYNDQVLFDLFWTDPLKDGQAFPKEGKGRGHGFYEMDTRAFLQANRASYLVRAHQLPEEMKGLAYHHSKKCITVFSASNYLGNANNTGAVLVCDGRRFLQEGPVPKTHWAPVWGQLADVFEQHRFGRAPEALGALAERMRVAEAMEVEMMQVSETNLAALKQVELYAVEQICKHKAELHSRFSSLDPGSSLQVPKAAWMETMAAVLSTVPNLWEDLAREWGVGDRVAYMEFLHRFQIMSEIWKRTDSTHVDVVAALSQLHVDLSDEQVTVLLSQLDSDVSGTVDFEEFKSFLEHRGTGIRSWQAATIFEILVTNLGRNPSVDDVLLCIALFSPVAKDRLSMVCPGGIPCATIARAVGETITASGKSLVAFFKSWDKSLSGYLEPREFERALREGLPTIGARLSAADVSTLLQYIDSQGVQNQRLSIVEFLRACGPPRLARNLRTGLLGEVLKPVYFHRQLLGVLLGQQDQTSSNVVTTGQFRTALHELNRQLEREAAADDAASDGESESDGSGSGASSAGAGEESPGGARRLTDCQVEAIIAMAGGARSADGAEAKEIRYRDFLQSLRSVDTVRRAAMANAGKLTLSLSFGLTPGLKAVGQA
eukprot:TRINITY_DN2957_c0_g4_i1.p1 TRINITY_DN2957_c0_g4~~TRINITY_DN2957_c0_g4_i1.p1  ORF type:complete len:1048 (+),score=144.06 TRINITY_DN2957_c0_g4_i1:345-3146(+)